MNATVVNISAAARMRRRGVLASLKVHECVPCASGPSGEKGHRALRYVMLAAETDRSFFRCAECGERWIRHPALAEGFAWTRYSNPCGHP